MSYLDMGSDEYIPQGHPDANVQQAQTIKRGFGPAQHETHDIASQAQPMTVSKTTPHAKASKAVGPAQQQHNGIKAQKTDVMVRSGNQEGEAVGVPSGFIWGLQGEGDAASKAGDPLHPVVKWGLVAGLGWLVWKNL
jgi:hypothetical protein